jgi:hypothetical protein
MIDDALMPKSPTSKRLNDPEHWRGLAREARAVGKRMIAGEARESMLRVAKLYEEMAERAEHHWVANETK